MDITPIAARLRVIANSVNALRELGEAPLETFASTFFLHAAAERDFQVAIQSALDIGAILLSEASTDIPTEYRDIFPKLAEIGVLPEALAQSVWWRWQSSVTCWSISTWKSKWNDSINISSTTSVTLTNLRNTLPTTWRGSQGWMKMPRAERLLDYTGPPPLAM